MANKGFYIKSVVAKGELVQDSQINFVKGCNVVYIVGTDIPMNITFIP